MMELITLACTLPSMTVQELYLSSRRERERKREKKTEREEGEVCRLGRADLPVHELLSLSLC